MAHYGIYCLLIIWQNHAVSLRTTSSLEKEKWSIDWPNHWLEVILGSLYTEITAGPSWGAVRSACRDHIPLSEIISHYNPLNTMQWSAVFSHTGLSIGSAILLITFHCLMIRTCRSIAYWLGLDNLDRRQEVKVDATNLNVVDKAKQSFSV